MRANSNRKPQNNKMQRTKHGLDGASPLILVFYEPRERRARNRSDGCRAQRGESAKGHAAPTA